MKLSSRVTRRWAAVATVLTVFMLLPAAALAQETGEAAGGGAVGGAVTTFGIGEWVGLGIRLALVVAAIWGGVAAMRWYVRRVNGGTSRRQLGVLEVLETHALGPNRTLHLVRLGDRAVLVGATPERITQLMTVDDPSELMRLTEPPEPEQASRATGRRVGGGLASLRTGLMAMNARRRVLSEHARAQRGGRGVDRQAMPAVPDGATGQIERRRFGALKGMLNRPTRPIASETPEAVEDRRQSLFDQTLASIDAIELSPDVVGGTAQQASTGLRARAGYGQTYASPAAPPLSMRGGMDSGRTREAQIADLQRAIAAARRNAS